MQIFLDLLNFLPEITSHTIKIIINMSGENTSKNRLISKSILSTLFSDILTPINIVVRVIAPTT